MESDALPLCHTPALDENARVALIPLRSVYSLRPGTGASQAAPTLVLAGLCAAYLRKPNEIRCIRHGMAGNDRIIHVDMPCVGGDSRSSRGSRGQQSRVERTVPANRRTNETHKRTGERTTNRTNGRTNGLLAGTHKQQQTAAAAAATPAETTAATTIETEATASTTEWSRHFWHKKGAGPFNDGTTSRSHL